MTTSSTIRSTRTSAALALCAVLVSPGMFAQQYPAPNQPDYVPSDATQDPPNRVARIAVVHGNVSLEPGGVDSFSQAELNYPLTAGDRLYVDNNSQSELQTSGLAVRMGNGADLTVSTLTDYAAQFGLAQGSIRVRTRDLGATPDGQPGTVEVDTPNGTILVERAGDIRIDSYPQDDSTVVTVSEGTVEVTGPNLTQTLGPNQSLRLLGSNPMVAERVRMLPADGLDSFDQQQDQIYQGARALDASYVDPGMIGASDLGQYGNWSADAEYGQIWYPREVPAGWAPYSNGHWAWVAPWGWTWIEAEPWGFAPFHYGRWASFNGRWGWVPGPPPALFGGRPPRPVYSPALVAFVGGSRFSLSVGFGGSSGAGVTAWFPLGPREVYTPWYHASPAYVNRVNATNLYTRDPQQFRNAYNNRTTVVYNTNITNVTYVNRSTATVAVAQRDFASGRGVAQSQHLRMDQNAQRQLAQAPLLPHPLVTPGVGTAAPQAPARALPPSLSRPVVQTQRGFERAGTPGQATPNVGPQTPMRSPADRGIGAAASGNGRQQPQAPAQTQPTRLQPGVPARQQPTPVAQPGQTPRGGFPLQRDHGPQQAPASNAVTPQQPPANPRAPVPQAPAIQAPNQAPAQLRATPQRVPAPQPDRPQAPAAVVQPAPAPTPARQAAPAAQPTPTQSYGYQRPAPRAPDQPRPLINRTEPQPAQPSFAQQQRAIQTTDPGRPLGPQQVQNLRNGQPAGQPTQPEAVAHPKPAPAPAAPVKRPPPPDNRTPHTSPQ